MRNQKVILFVNIFLAALFAAFSVVVVLCKEQNEEVHIVREIDNQWAYFLINRDNPLPDDYSPELSAVEGKFMLDSRCADYAVQMLEDARAEGLDVAVVSAYRSSQKQKENYSAYISRLIKEGYSSIDAAKITAKEIAPPGASEHNAGLALDILTGDWWATHNDVTDDFENTDEFRWLSENSWKYGFILRYPKEDEETTGYIYEPWHYRFVGLYYAESIYRSRLCMEDYVRLTTENK